MADECCSRKGEEIASLAAKSSQRRVLVVVMTINIVMFITEFSGGLIAGSRP